MTRIFKVNFYDWERLKELDPTFNFPGFVFNSGQFVVNRACVAREEIGRFYDPPESGNRRQPDVFTIYGDQGVLNYVLPKMQQEGRLTIGRVRFDIWADPASIGPDVISLESQQSRRGIPKVVHYAGQKFPLNSQCLASRPVELLRVVLLLASAVGLDQTILASPGAPDPLVAEILLPADLRTTAPRTRAAGQVGRTFADCVQAARTGEAHLSGGVSARHTPEPVDRRNSSVANARSLRLHAVCSA